MKFKFRTFSTATNCGQLAFKSLLSAALVLLASGVGGQTYFNMSSGNYSQNFNGITTLPTNFSTVAVLSTGTIPVATRTTTASTSSLSVVGSGAAVGIDATTSTQLVFLTTGATDNSTAIATDLNLNFSSRTAGTLSFTASTIFNQTGNRVGTLKVYYSTDATTWTELTGTNLPYIATNNVAGSGAVSISLPSALNNQSTVKLRFYYHNGTGGSSGSRPRIGIDDLTVTSTAATTPTIVASSSTLTGFSAVTGSNSTSQNFTVRATNVTERMVLTAPSGYQLSRDNTTFQDTVHTAFVVDSVPTQTIHVRQTSSTLGTTSGNIACTSAGATTVNVSVSGVVLSTEPTTQPTLTVGTITTSTIDLTIGNTAGLTNWIVVAREGSAVDGVPVDGTDYTANATFSSGAVINTNNRVVLKGNGTSLTVTVPNPATAYHFAIYAYNDGGVAASTNYNATSPGTANATTLAVPLGWQINATNSLFTINFDGTVANVNNGVFAAATTFGASNPSSGQLNSNAWAYNANAGGAATFGGNLSSGFGASTGGVTSSGVFAFEVSTGNVALGIQPTGTVFQAGGHLTLRIQNKTGATLNNVQLSYTLWVNNNEARSTTIGFSTSTDNSTYTAVNDANFNSTLASQGSVLWVPQYYSITLSSLNIAADGFLYLRWTGTDNGGSGSRDEFAIDDINFIAERTSTNLATSGSFENMLIDGNVNVSSASTVTGILNLKSGVLGSSGNLTLKSTTNGTATVVGGTNSSISGNVTVERFLPWQSSNNNGFRFTSHSLQAAPALNTITALPTGSNTVIGYDEDLSTTNGGYIALNDRTTTWGLGKSVGIWTNAVNTISYTGALQLSDLNSVAVDFAGTSTGWNFMGNPFPSVIDFDALTRSNVNNASYVWIKDNVASGSGTWGTYINGTTANGGSRYLAPGQGFVVKATATPATISFPASARVTGQSPTFNLVNPDELKVKITKTANATSFETVLKFEPGATDGLDGLYDAELMSDSRSATPDLYTRDRAGVRYTVNSLPLPEVNEYQVHDLWLETFGEGTFRWSFDMSNLRFTQNVILEDTKLGMLIQLNHGQELTFRAAANDPLNRFRLHFNRQDRTSSTVSTEDQTLDRTQVYAHENEIYVRGLDQADVVRITDLSGRTVVELIHADLTAGVIRTNLASGTYLVQLQHKGASKITKVVLH